MIIDLEKFVAAEQAYWDELSSRLDALELGSRSAHGHASTLDLAGAERLHYLYTRTASDLARLATFSAESELRRALDALVARAYAEIHARTGQDGGGPSPRAALPGQGFFSWFAVSFPCAFRRHLRAFALSVAVTLLGITFGSFAVAVDPDAKAVILPFSHLQGNPADRVAEEEQSHGESLAGRKATFSGQLMSHNIKVSIFALALGLTWGIGTLTLILYNGVVLGAVCFDYLRAGQGVFLAGWLLPHGSVEIPSFLLAGQAGLMLGGALVGWGRRRTLRERLREVRGDLVTIIGGVAVMLVWAGIIEAFFSQYHAPVLPYSVKIAFGAVELVGLTWFLARGGAAGSR